jgi:phenylalanyl-tRNA synthetase beta chain
MAVMRTSLWCGLLDAALKNQFRQQPRIRLFEVGNRFIGSGSDLTQTPCIAGLAMGSALPEQWAGSATAVDFFDVKSDLEALLALTGRADQSQFEAALHPALHPGQSGKVALDGRDLGWCGMLHPRLEQSLGFEQQVFLFQLELAPLLQRAVARFQPLSRFPQVRRDLALVVDETVTAGQLVRCARSVDSSLLRSVMLFDVYQGKGVEAGKKSIAIGLTLQDDTETLTDARVDAVIRQVVERLGNELNATLRA